MRRSSDVVNCILHDISCHDSDERIIFLDVDGVIANTLTHLEKARKADRKLTDPVDQLVPSCVRVLKSIVDITGSKIVISSTWRKLIYDLVPLLCVMHDNNIPVVGSTPSLPSGRRDDEILAYMREHRIKSSNVIILDDSVGDLDGVSKMHYRVNSKYGLRKLDIPGILAVSCGRDIIKTLDRKTLLDMIDKLSSCNKLTQSRRLGIEGAATSITDARCLSIALCNYVSTSKDSRDSAHCRVALSAKSWSRLFALYGFER